MEKQTIAMTIVFDKLAAVRRLEQAEFSRPQAEAMTDVFHDAVHGAVATKADLSETRAELKAELSETRAELKADIAAARSEVADLRSEMREQRSELKLWMAGAVLAGVGALGTLMSFLLRARGLG